MDTKSPHADCPVFQDTEILKRVTEWDQNLCAGPMTKNCLFGEE